MRLLINFLNAYVRYLVRLGGGPVHVLLTKGRCLRDIGIVTLSVGGRTLSYIHQRGSQPTFFVVNKLTRLRV